MTEMSRFGPSLSRLVAGRGSALCHAEVVSPLRGGVACRAAYLLHFADGQVLKGRVLESVQQAHTVWSLSQSMRASWPRAPLSRVQAWEGDALLEQWLPGESLSTSSVSVADLRKAGALLGRLHRAVPNVARDDRPVEPEWVEASLDCASLQATAGLDGVLVSRASQRARAHQPAVAQWGWCHGDFCGENLIRVPRRGLWLVDNETIGEHWFDHDLARTWYRWALRPSQWVSFLEGYAEQRSPAAFEQHFHFWIVCVLLRAVQFRLRARLDTRAPVARLEALYGEQVTP